MSKLLQKLPYIAQNVRQLTNNANNATHFVGTSQMAPTNIGSWDCLGRSLSLPTYHPKTIGPTFRTSLGGCDPWEYLINRPICLNEQINKFQPRASTPDTQRTRNFTTSINRARSKTRRDTRDASFFRKFFGNKDNCPKPIQCEKKEDHTGKTTFVCGPVDLNKKPKECKVVGAAKVMLVQDGKGKVAIDSKQLTYEKGAVQPKGAKIKVTCPKMASGKKPACRKKSMPVFDFAEVLNQDAVVCKTEIKPKEKMGESVDVYLGNKCDPVDPCSASGADQDVKDLPTCPEKPAPEVCEVEEKCVEVYREEECKPEVWDRDIPMKEIKFEEEDICPKPTKRDIEEIMSPQKEEICPMKCAPNTQTSSVKEKSVCQKRYGLGGCPWPKMTWPCPEPKRKVFKEEPEVCKTEEPKICEKEEPCEKICKKSKKKGSRGAKFVVPCPTPRKEVPFPELYPTVDASKADPCYKGDPVCSRSKKKRNEEDCPKIEKDCRAEKDPCEESCSMSQVETSGKSRKSASKQKRPKTSKSASTCAPPFIPPCTTPRQELPFPALYPTLDACKANPCFKGDPACPRSRNRSGEDDGSGGAAVCPECKQEDCCGARFYKEDDCEIQFFKSSKDVCDEDPKEEHCEIRCFKSSKDECDEDPMEEHCVKMEGKENRECDERADETFEMDEPRKTKWRSKPRRKKIYDSEICSRIDVEQNLNSCSLTGPKLSLSLAADKSERRYPETDDCDETPSCDRYEKSSCDRYDVLLCSDPCPAPVCDPTSDICEHREPVCEEEICDPGDGPVAKYDPERKVGMEEPCEEETMICKDCDDPCRPKKKKCKDVCRDPCPEATCDPPCPEAQKLPELRETGTCGKTCPREKPCGDEFRRCNRFRVCEDPEPCGKPIVCEQEKCCKKPKPIKMEPRNCCKPAKKRPNPCECPKKPLDLPPCESVCPPEPPEPQETCCKKEKKRSCQYDKPKKKMEKEKKKGRCGPQIIIPLRKAEEVVETVTCDGPPECSSREEPKKEVKFDKRAPPPCPMDRHTEWTPVKIKGEKKVFGKKSGRTRNPTKFKYPAPKLSRRLPKPPVKQNFIGSAKGLYKNIVAAVMPGKSQGSKKKASGKSKTVGSVSQAAYRYQLPEIDKDGNLIRSDEQWAFLQEEEVLQDNPCNQWLLPEEQETEQEGKSSGRQREELCCAEQEEKRSSRHECHEECEIKEIRESEVCERECDCEREPKKRRQTKCKKYDEEELDCRT